MKQLKLHSMRSLRPARLIQCLIVTTLLGHDLNCQGQNNSILLPRPQQINYTDDSLKLTDSPDIYPGNYYERWINKTADTLRSPYRIRLSQHLPQIPLNQEEAYRIEITRQHIFVEAVTTTGVYRAMQTLEQLSRKKEGSLVFPTCQITDWPAFRIRGFLLPHSFKLLPCCTSILHLSVSLSSVYHNTESAPGCRDPRDPARPVRGTSQEPGQASRARARHPAPPPRQSACP